MLHSVPQHARILITYSSPVLRIKYLSYVTKHFWVGLVVIIPQQQKKKTEASQSGHVYSSPSDTKGFELIAVSFITCLLDTTHPVEAVDHPNEGSETSFNAAVIRFANWHL